MSDNERLTVREAARRRIPLAGADAQALEGALALTERERDEWRKRYEALPGSLRDAHDVLLGLQKELSHALATVEAYKAIAAKAEERGFVWGLEWNHSGCDAADPAGYRKTLAEIVCKARKQLKSGRF